MQKKYPVLLGLLVATVGASLVNTKWFGNPTFTAFFLYGIGAALVCVCGATTLLFNTKQKLLSGNKTYLFSNTFPFLTPDLLFLLLYLYSLLHALFSQSYNINLTHIYIAANFLLLIVLTGLFKYAVLKREHVFSCIIIIASIESIICLLQYAGVISSKNLYFRVTGTYVNPNVTAMFLALCIPLLLWKAIENFHNKKGNSNVRVFYIICLLLALSACVLLKCRTAWIGIAVSCSIILNNRYGLIKLVKQKLHIWQIILLLLCSIFLIISLVWYSYKAKQASADGRVLVWKVCMQMIAEKPLTGYGYGRFEFAYNLAQAKYFVGNKVSWQEINNASFVQMAYSEVLQNAVEGGLTGLILLLLLFLSLLKTCSKKRVVNDAVIEKSIVPFACIVAFATMSIFNFTMQAIPVMCLLIIYSAMNIGMTATGNEQMKKKYGKYQNSKIVYWCIIIIGIYLCISQVNLAKAYVQNENSRQLTQDHNQDEALAILHWLENDLYNEPSYWINSAHALYYKNEYAEAAGKLKQALTLTSNPEIYLRLGDCFVRSKQIKEAEIAYMTAQNIVPCMLKPHYALMQLYAQVGDTSKALAMAQKLQLMQPKGGQAQAKQYKVEAEKLIMNYEHVHGDYHPQ